MKLNFEYFTGQTFNLDQETMNKMIRDVEKLKEFVKYVDHHTQECAGVYGNDLLYGKLQDLNKV